MNDAERRQSERRMNSVHEDCHVHTGVAEKLNINIWLNIAGCGLLAYLIIVALDIRSSQNLSELRIERLEQTVHVNSGRLNDLERQSYKLHDHDPRGEQ